MPSPNDHRELKYRMIKIKVAVAIAELGKPYLRVQEPPDAATLADFFPTQDTSEHENKEYEIRDECTEDRDLIVQ